MLQYDEKLTAIAQQLRSGVSPQSETVRAFLRWFGAERRGWRVVTQIRSVLAHYQVSTKPDFEYAYIDRYIEFAMAPRESTDEPPDPTVRLSRLEAANRTPLYIAPDATLQQAVTQMLAKDYSQLPVMTGSRDVKGLVSWKSIGSRLALKRPCNFVRECMDEAKILSSSTSLFEAIAVVAADDCILVQAADRTICGIVTATDLNDQFRLLAEPFLLVGEIERAVRSILHGKFSVKELEQARAPGDDRVVSRVSDLTIGEYVSLVQDEGRWRRLDLSVDRAEFSSRLDRVRELRNDVMHFDTDGLESGDMGLLREFAEFLRRLRAIGAA